MKKIKKLLLLLVACITTLSITGCKEKNVEGNLPDIMEKVYEKVYAEVSENDRPAVITVNVEEEFDGLTDEDRQALVKFAIGTTEIDYKEIYESKPTIGAIAYSVVLVRMEEGADVEAAKKAIKENVNPRKWVCAGIAEEEVIVKSKGDLIILIMVENETLREKLEKGFDNL